MKNKYLFFGLLYLIFLVSETIYSNDKDKDLPCPQPIYPGGGEIPLLPLIDWTDVEGAVTYQLQISINSDFTIVILDVQVTKSRFQLLVPLFPLFHYYWRVRATNDSDYGPFCWYIYFATGGGN